MKINVDAELVNLNGDVLLDINSKGESVNATVKTCLVNAVLAPVEKELGIDKVKKYELAKLIFKGGEVDLTIDDITFIKKSVGDNFTPLVVGQIFELLKV